MTTLTEILSQVKLFLAKERKQENKLHATTIESVTPGPDLYKNTASDYCSFMRQKSDDSNSIGPWLSNMLKIIVMAGASLDVLLLF